MKFTGAFSALLLALPLLVSAAPAPNGGRGSQSRANNNKGNIRFGGKLGGNNNANNKGGAAASGTAAASVAAASGTAAAGAASNSTAAASTAAAASSTAAAAGAAGAAGAGNAANEQSSLTLDPSTIGPNLALTGQAVAEAGQVASLTSVNNFINFCVGKTVTNGLQAQAGSCNPVPMGDIPAKAAQPACKFSFPTNLANIGENTAFTIKMNIQGMQTGAFTNPNTNYFGAPQQLNAQGQIVGHSHVVIQAINGVADTAPADPNVFAFFQGLNAAAAGGVLTSDVAKGLPAGTYRLFSINTAANHQPVIGPVAQHGSFDDAVYFTVGAAAATAAQQAVGAAGAAAAGAGAGAAAASSAAAAASGTAAAAASGTAAAAASGTAAAVASKSAAAAATASAVAGGVKTGAAGGVKAPVPVSVKSGAAGGVKGAAQQKGGKGRRSFNIARQN